MELFEKIKTVDSKFLFDCIQHIKSQEQYMYINTLSYNLMGFFYSCYDNLFDWIYYTNTQNKCSGCIGLIQ